MPVIARSPEGKVVSLWGTALIRGADGKLRLLKVGDVVRQGDQILTTQDGIVQIDNGEAPVRSADGKAPAGADDVEQAITALNRGDRDAAPAAGLAGGGEGSMQGGLRVDRIAEGVGATEVPRSTSDAELRAVAADTGVGSTGASSQGGSSLPPLDAPSSSISAAEEGAPANLGLTAPTGAAAGGTVRVDQVPAVGEIRKADGTLVTAGTLLSPADLPGLSYVPPADYDGSLPPGSFTYTLTTSDGRSSTGSTAVTLTSVNDAPVATPGTGSGNEDAALPINLAGTDVDGSVVGVTVTALPSGGTLWLADGVTPVVVGQTLAPADAATLVYRPGTDFNGSQSILFTVTDNAGATSAPAAVALTVVAVNDAPSAADDAARAVGTAPVTIDVLANDRDVDGDALGVGSASVDPALGSVTVNADGSLRFTAAPGVTGPVTVSYTVTDGNGGSSSATLTVNVAAGPSVTVDAPALTSDATPTITGTSNLPAGSAVAVVVTDAAGAAQNLSAVVSASGTFAVNVPVSLAEGSYTVVATASDGFGNSASASDGGAIDLTAPSLTVDAPTLTNDPTPTISGTTNLPAGSTVGLVVTDAAGGTQILTVTVSAGGTFSADVPAALPEGSFSVVATATDAAGNSASASDAGTVDVSAPALTVDAPALTNDATPMITGTTDLPAGSTVSVVVTDSTGSSQTLVGTVAAGGTFSVDVPAALAEGTFTVVATATDAAGNSASANDAGSVDVTAPTLTVDAPALTNDSTPTITGTTSLPAGSSVTLVVTDALGASQTVTATVVAGGTFSVDVPAALAEGAFTVTATATDLAGNSASANDAGSVDVTAPSLTVDAPALTNDATPTITGTTNLPAGSSVSVVVTDALGASQTISAPVAAGGTFSVDVPAALAEGAFTVVATAADAAGNSANANDAGSVDITAPTLTVDAPALTNDSTPTITGTTNLPAGSLVTLVVTDALGASQTITATVAAGSTFSVDVPVALAEGAFTVTATATDAAGNSASANDAGSVDVTAPALTVDAPALTNDATPTITGTTSLPAGSSVSLVVTDALGASQSITATVAAGGSFSVDVPAALAEGAFTVVATATDAAGNSASANDAGSVDVTAPTLTVDAPALTNDSTPTITGTTSLPAGSSVSLVVTDALGASQSITATVAAGGSFSVDVPAALAEGAFTVTATATDAAGNSASANDAGSVDVTAPTLTVDAPALTNDSTPTITGTTSLPAGTSVTLFVTDALGASQTVTATVAAGGTFSVDVPSALAEGAFTVTATAVDAAGNSATANDAGSVDLTAPSLTVDAPALTNDATPTISGATNLPAGSTVSLVVTDALGATQTLSATVAAGGTFSIDVPAALAEGAFTVTATATDAAGNSASANDAGSVDVTAPSLTVDAPALTNDATPTITGTTNLPAGSTVSIVVTDASGASQTITATVAAGSTYSVEVPVALAEGAFTVTATATDAAGNSASANDAGSVDVTAPTLTVDVPALTNDATPTITGTTSLPAGSTVTLVVTDALGASQTITAAVAAGGTYSVDVPVALAEGSFTVVATATDVAGNSASANDAGAVDVTTPSVTVDAPSLTNDSTPTITGTASLPAGSTVSLVVTDAAGVSQTFTATVAAGGAYSVDVPAALAEGSFSVVATATDAAGNSANANDVGTVDVTAPTITVDAPALTNDTTPTITGTTSLPAGSTVTLVVSDSAGAPQIITTTVAAGGTFSVEVPAALAEGSFTVVATATDAAGNTASANDAGAIDTTAPTITVDAPALTNDATPTVTGTTSLPAGSTISLLVTDALGASQTIIATVVAGGTYSVDVPAALAEGSFTVVATATDAAGNSANANDVGTVDVTAPSITVDAPALTNDATPTITGTTSLPAGSTVSLVITDALGASQTITALVAAGGTYSVDVPNALAEGSYSVVATATDAAGNIANANDAGTVDVTAPSITVDAPALTNDTTPTITGTTNLPAGSTISLLVTDALGASQTVTATVATGGTYSVDVPAALAEGSFTVVATAIDAAGNGANANDVGTVDVTAPSITVDAPALTNDSTPSITGTTSLPAGSTVSLAVTDAAGVSQTFTATVAAGGTYAVDVPAALAEGSFTVVATATDAAGNTATANDAGAIDTTVPTITVDAPALTNDSTPTITGTTNLPAGSTVSLVITDALGASQTVIATVAAGGTYSADAPSALAEGNYSVVATAIDAAGNSANANDVGTVDVTAPSITVDVPALTNDATPTITGTTSLPTGSTVSLVVTDALGVSQTVTATVAAGGTYSADVPSVLAEGNFTVVATATDAAGNSASANDAGSVDVTAPTVTVDAPALTNDTTPTITGTTNLLAGSTVSLVVTDAAGVSQTFTATVAAGGTYSVGVPAALAEGSFTVVATATDAAGNSASANDAGAIDITAPTITVDAPALTNDSTPSITGTTSLPAGSAVTLVVNDSAGASQTITATVNAGGTFSVNVPAALAEGSFTVVATATDAAGNSANANDVGTVDVTAPSITVDAPALTNDSTPTITGTTNLPAGSTVTLVVADALGATQTITATVTAGGTFSVNVPAGLAEGSFTVVATATDAAGNSANANDVGTIDVTAPTITVDVPALTNDTTPTISGTTNLPAGAGISLVVTDAAGVSQTFTATVAAGGTYAVDVPAALAEGSFTVVATATDAAGNTATANDAGTVDVTAPSITVDAPALTNDATPTITGTTSLPAGSTISLVVTDALGASQTLTATVATGGTYSVDVPVALAEGNYSVVATAIDAAGNSANANDVGTIDVTAPTITVDAPALTNDTTPAIAGTTSLPAGSAVTLVVTDALGAQQTITATVAAGGTYSVAVPAALAEGSFTVVATATDAAGNSANANDVGVVDVTAPTITVDAPTLTNDSTPTISGTTSLPAGSTVSLVVTDALGASQTVVATVGVAGSFAVAVPTALAEGSFTVVATAVDAAGNSASANDTGAVDVTAPTLTVDAPALTNDTTPAITGTTDLPAGSTVTLLVTDAAGATQSFTATVAAGGTWSVDVPAALAEGAFTVVATVTDAAGNTASANDAGSVDATAPTITVDAPGLTNDTTPTISGTTNLPAGSTVTLVVTDALGAQQSIAATVAAGGSYSVDVPATLADGGFTVVATAVDAAGNSASANDSGVIDATAPSITVDAPALTNDATPAITGTSNLPAGSTVTLVVTDAAGASQTFSATVGAGGSYAVAVPAVLAEGSFTVVASATDAAGNAASASDAGVVDITPPAASLTLAPVTADNVLSAAEAGGNVVLSGQAGGDAVAGDIVELTISGQVFQAVVGAGGAFSVSVPGSVLAADADSTIIGSLTLTDAAGNFRVATALQSYLVNTAPSGTSVTVSTPEDSPYAFTAADFGYTDANGQPLVSVRIDTLPAAGQLLLGSVAVVAGQQIAAADLASLRFVPAADANGTGHASFSFSVSDGIDFDATPNQITIDVTPVNDAPVAQPAAFAVAEDAAVVNGAVTASDVDAGATLGYALNGAAPAGLSFNADGSYSFDPSVAAYQSLAAGQSTVITVPFTVTDNAGATSTANLVITVTGTNDTPVAVANTGSVNENATLNASAATGVLANDSDADAGDSLTVSAVSFGATSGTVGNALAGSYGTLTLNSDGSYSYVANGAAAEALAGGQVATDTFAYTVRDASGATATTTLTFTVTGTDDVPTITGPLTGAVQEDGTLTSTGTLLITDADAGQSSFVAQTATAGTYGTFAITAGGVWTYTLNNAAANVQALPGSAAPTESFTVTTVDGTTRVITVTVAGSNDAAAIGGTATGAVTEDTGVVAGNLSTGGTLTVSDVDAGEAAFQPQASTAGAYGTFTLAANGVWTYTASNSNTAIQNLGQGQTLTETFTVRAADGTASSVVVTINGTNDAAVIGGISTGSVTEDASVVAGNISTGGTLTVSDVDSGQATFQPQASTAGTYGTFTVAANGSWTYTASNANTAIQTLGAGATLTETFTVRSADGTPWNVNVTIVGTNDAPVAQASSFTVAEDTAVVTGSVNATDIDTGSTLTYALNGAAPAGLTFNADGSYSFNPANAAYQSLGAGQQQVITVPYTVTDNAGASSTANLVITVTGTNDAAVVSGTSTGSITEDTSVVAGNLSTGGTLTVSDADAGQAAFQPQASTAGTYGTFTLAANGAWTYTASNANTAIQNLGAGQTLSETFTVRSADGTTSSVGVTIIGTNDAPLAQASSFTVAEDAAIVNGSVTATDIDAGATLSYALNGPAPAGLTFNANGSYSFNPANAAYQSLAVGQQQVITVPYTVTDNAGATSTANLVITVTGTNDAPVANANTGPALEDGPVTIPFATLLSNDTDVDAGTTLTITSVQSPVNGTVAIVGGNVVFTPTANYSGPASFTYTISDGNGGTSTATVNVNVGAVADAPTLVINGTSGTGGTVPQPVLPPSSGLVREFFQDIATVGTNNAGSITAVETAVDAATATSTTTVTDIAIADLNVDDAYQYTGFVYLQAGQTYQISGSRDDTLLVKLGGNTVYGVGYNNWGSFTASGFTPSVSGYYSIEVVAYNGDGVGNLDINMSVNGGPALDLNTTNFRLYASTTDFTGSPTVSGPLVPNGDGGYYPAGANGTEDSSIRLGTISASLNDTDGSETLSLAVGSIPVGAVLTDGTNTFTATAGNTSVNVTGWSLSNLSITPPLNFSGTINLSVTATATEASGQVATTTGTLPVTVTAVADAPVVAGNTTLVTVGQQDVATTIGLPVMATLFDADGSETLAIVISGVPTGATLSAGTNTGGGTWSLTPAQLAGLTITLPANFEPTTNPTAITVTAVSTESSTGAQSSAAQTISLYADATDATTNGTNAGETATAANNNDRFFNMQGGDDTVNAGSGDDLVRGGTGNDTLRGNAGNDALWGEAGNDVIIGGAGIDLIRGGSGSDTLTGGTGAVNVIDTTTDVFAWSLADRGTAGTPALDTITDFNAASASAGGDVLDLRDLLSGEALGAGNSVGNLANYLDFSVSGSGASATTTIRISSTGGFTGGNYAAGAEDQTIVLQGVDLPSALGLAGGASDAQIVQELINRGKLIVDNVGP